MPKTNFLRLGMDKSAAALSFAGNFPVGVALSTICSHDNSLEKN